MQNEEINYIEPGTPAAEEQIKELQAEIIPTPDNPPWYVLAAIGTWLASVVFIVIFPNIFVLPYLMKQNINFANQAATMEFAKTDPTAVLLQVAAIIPAHLFTLILAWLVVTRFRKFSFRQTLGWNAKSLKWWNYLLIMGGVFALAGIVQYVAPATENDLEQMLKVSRAVVYIVAFLATFTAPLVEEVIYRGILYSAFLRKLGLYPAIIISTLLFALVHVPQYYPSYSTIFIICVLSLILTSIRATTKNLLPCIIFHTIFNAIQSIGLVASIFFSQDSPIPPPEHAASFLKLFW